MTTISTLVDQWLAWDRNEETRKEIQDLRDAKNEAKLQTLLGVRMAFGTAGLRARMGAGNSQMNHLTVIQTAQGLAAYMRAQFSAEVLAAQGIVLGFDGRHHSQEFAQLTAAVMKANHIKVYLYDCVVPTPYVPFAIRHFKCVSGVMVTASHNPKWDNGYKVYWNNGAQIVSPHDKGIADAILANLEPQPSSWEFSNGDVNPIDEIHKAYMSSLREQYTPLAHTNGKRPELHFTYSAMHGVGFRFTRESVALCGVPADCFHSVQEQESPDPEFPTVEFPNPEEGKSSLELSFKTATRTNSQVILANDPDADRLAVAERQPEGLPWRVFNGNEIGTLLGWWAVHHAKLRGDDLDKCYLLSSTVSSPILGSIAKKEGLHFQDTLTGFKWMGGLASQLEQDGSKRVLLAFEEAIGFMWGNRVYDKDGVTAAGVCADMARYLWETEGCTLSEKLTQLYKMYGYHFSYNSYVVAPDPVKMLAALKNIATMENGGYPSALGGVHVAAVRDLSTGLDTRMADRKATLPTSASSPILTFYLENGITFTVRGSGTEPKLKWYTSFVTPDPNGLATLRKVVDTAVKELIQPEKYGFQRRKADIEADSSR